jgi:mono/diheme cytochrome c family protein
MKKPKKNKPQPPAKAAARPSGDTEQMSSPVRTTSASASGTVVPEIGDEPTASRAAVPVLFIALLGTMIFFADMFIVKHGGQLDAKVYQPYKDTEEVTLLNPVDPIVAQLNKGRQVYTTVCSGCHQNDGAGSRSVNAPPLAGSEWVSVNDPSRLIRIVLHGLAGPITVKGEQWGQGVMLAFKDAMTDEQIALALSYIRNSWGNKAPVVEVEQVKKIREETKEWGGSMTVEELNKVLLKN